MLLGNSGVCLQIAALQLRISNVSVGYTPDRVERP